MSRRCKMSENLHDPLSPIFTFPLVLTTGAGENCTFALLLCVSKYCTVFNLHNAGGTPPPTPIGTSLPSPTHVVSLIWKQSASPAVCAQQMD